ncbi:MAG: hypothetical protein QOI66_2941 [Myxococcales bacterium]|nr:hypothetical protein [Myxococcales bacterium]
MEKFQQQVPMGSNVSVSSSEPSILDGSLPVSDRLHLPPANPYDSAPLPFDLVLIGAGVNVAVRSFFRAVWGWRRYPGKAPDICRSVIEDCWTGDFFAGSAGHFKQFWTRDLAMCTPALCRLGFRDRVIQSWAFGLDRFERAGKVTTTIFNKRFPRDVYAYACDSVPMTLFALRHAGAQDLIVKHRELLSREIVRFAKTVLDPELGMARTDGYFSGPRDCMTGRSTVFANTMIALLARLVEDDPLLPNPFAGIDVRGNMLRQHWTGQYFRDSLCREEPSGDGNIWPFFFEVFDDKTLQRRSFETLESRGFTTPIPLRYFQHRLPDSELPIPKMFTPNYQGDPSWTQLGPVYLGLLAGIDRPKMIEHRDRVASFIERDGNYLELYTPDGRPYKGRAMMYHADEGMVWAAMFLDLYDR